MEAEYNALGIAVKEVIHLKSWLKQFQGQLV